MDEYSNFLFQILTKLDILTEDHETFLKLLKLFKKIYLSYNLKHSTFIKTIFLHNMSFKIFKLILSYVILIHSSNYSNHFTVCQYGFISYAMS